MSLNVRRVLCAVDFSECSGRTLYAAATFARRYHAHLSAVHVHALAPEARRVGAGGAVATDRTQRAVALRHLVTLETSIVQPDAGDRAAVKALKQWQ